MNIVRELRIKKGIQQKELALELGISSAAVSNWEKGKSDPSGERLKRLAEIFGVDELVILGKDKNGITVFPHIEGKTETEQITEYILKKLGVDLESEQPRTEEARILAKAVDRMPQAQRERALAIFRAVFATHADEFEKGTETNDT